MSATAAEDDAEWYERWPERREWELTAFEALDLPATERIADDGRLVIETEMRFRDQPIVIEIYFPRDYPDFAPQFRGPTGLLERHQIKGRYLCVLEDPGNDWWPGWSAAELVDRPLRALLKDSERAPEAVAAREADMVDSISAQISYMSGGAVLVPDPFWAREFELDHGGFTLLQVIGDSLRLLYRVEGCDQPDESVVARLTSSGAHRRSGTWVQLPEPPSPWPSHQAILEAARTVFPGLFSSARSELARKYKLKHVEQWIGVTFLEEGPRRGETRRAWVFAEVRLERGGAPELRRVVEAHPVTAEARELRTPELVGLAEARIAVIGAGSLGGPITLELAKAGVGQIFLVDRDSYQASNSVRHVLSTWDTGRSKAIGVAVAAEQLNPLVEITPQVTTINGSNAGDLLADAEVVVDTTGSQAVGRMLSRRCREMGKRFVVAGLTNGAYGGDLVILDPDGPCFMCFVMRQDADEIPSPVSAPRSNATAHGCGYPTFAGAGFDATALAALVTRAVVGAGGWCAYPKPGYDWAVVNFRDGEPWRQGRLERHPGCPVCGHA